MTGTTRSFYQRLAKLMAFSPDIPAILIPPSVNSGGFFSAHKMAPRIPNSRFLQRG